jgi:hypothetical protein
VTDAPDITLHIDPEDDERNSPATICTLREETPYGTTNSGKACRLRVGFATLRCTTSMDRCTSI